MITHTNQESKSLLLSSTAQISDFWALNAKDSENISIQYKKASDPENKSLQTKRYN